MPLSDITRKQARSDVLARLDMVEADAVIEEEINLWLDKAQFDYFVRMGVLVEKWYGKNETISITASAGAITQIALEGNYSPEKIASITKFILADGSTIYRPVEYKKLEYMLGNTIYDNTYAFAWYGTNLHIFVGTSAAALSTDSSVLHFIRKPDEMGGDNNVHTVVFASVVEDDTVTVDGIVMTARDAATTEVADFVTTGTDTQDGENFEDVLENIFSSITGVSAASAAGTVTITGAKTVTSSNGTRLAVTATTASMLDVPTEHTELIIMGAQARALGKLGRVPERQVVEGKIAQGYTDIFNLYGVAIQTMQGEAAAGIQTPRIE